MLDNDNVKAPTICLITDSVTVKNVRQNPCCAIISLVTPLCVI